MDFCVACGVLVSISECMNMECLLLRELYEYSCLDLWEEVYEYEFAAT